MIRVRCERCGQPYPEEALHWCAAEGDEAPRNADWLEFDEKAWRREYMRRYMRRKREKERAAKERKR